MPWWGYEVIVFVVQTDKMEGVTSLRMKFVSKKFLFTKQHHHHRYYHQLTTQNFTIFGFLDIRFSFFVFPFSTPMNLLFYYIFLQCCTSYHDSWWYSSRYFWFFCRIFSFHFIHLQMWEEKANPSFSSEVGDA